MFSITSLCRCGWLIMFAVLTALVGEARRRTEASRFPSSVRVRLDWECKLNDTRRTRAEAFLVDLARAVHKASGQRWCIRRFYIDDGYTPINISDEGVIYFHAIWTPPSADTKASGTFGNNAENHKAGARSHPGWVHLGLNLFRDESLSRQRYAERAAQNVILAWTGKTNLPLSDKPVSYAPPVLQRRSGLKVVIRTGADRAAGTDDEVTLDVGTGQMRLDNPAKNDFLPGMEDTFYLYPGRGFRGKAIPYVRVMKGRDGHGGEWLLHSLELFYRGESIFLHPCILKWFQGREREWEVSGKRSIAKKQLQSNNPVRSVLALVQTGDDPLAGSTGIVRLHLGKETVLVRPRNGSGLQPGSLTILRLKPRNLRTVADIADIRLTKSRAKRETGWQLKSLTIYVNNQVLYEKKDVNVWLRKGDWEWKALDYRPPAS